MRRVDSPPSAVSRRYLTIPNALSLARLASVPVIVWLFVAGHENSAVVLYALGALTDFLDGYIARRTGTVTQLGQALDPLADRVFIVALALVLINREALPTWLAGVIVIRDAAILGALLILERRGLERIPVSGMGKLATATLLFGLSWLALGETSLWGSGAGEEIGITFTGAGAVLYWAAGVGYAQEARRRMKRANQEGAG
ncbi:MAG: CDP-alcohol phosphatidyltransferase family protein [Actinomycetota bacterium]